MNQLQNHSVSAFKYVTDIIPNTWRNTCWNLDDSLPPRYGINTSNISESSNSMFEKARDCSWLDSIDIMLDIMSNRIYLLKKKYIRENACDIVAPIVGHLKKLYDASAGFVIIGTDDNEALFRIKRTDLSLTESRVWHDIDITNQTCSCGKWQEREYPCIDAMGFFRNHELLTFDKIVSTKVSVYYNYDSLQALYKENISSVSLSTLVSDGVTMPPKNQRKRQTGRPKKDVFVNDLDMQLLKKNRV